VLDYFKNNVIEEIVEKVAYKAEANRHFNFPYEAIEEALSNAVYHKSYEMDKPIEVQVWGDRIEILSFPGPVPPVDAQILKQNKRIVARDYRNRRIGDLLKELHLTEGRGTGFPTIRNAMKENNAPEPIFETDEQSTYFLTVLMAKEQISVTTENIPFNNLEELSHFLNTESDLARDQAKTSDSKEKPNLEKLFSEWSDQASDQAVQIIENDLNDKALTILNILDEPKKRVEILEHINLSNHSRNREKYLDPLVKLGWIEMTIPEKRTHQDQKYKRSIQGEILHKLIVQRNQK
jgi:ATP-dependent DNA helicase RecG